MSWRSGNPLMMYWNSWHPSFLGHGEDEGFCLHYNHQPLPHPWSKQVDLILSNHECRWRLRSVPLGLYTLYPWTGVVVPGQFQLRSQDPALPSVWLILRLWWLTGSGEALQLLLPWAIPSQFHSFYLTLVNRFCSWSWKTLVGIEPQTCLVKSQHFTTELSWQTLLSIIWVKKFDQLFWLCWKDFTLKSDHFLVRLRGLIIIKEKNIFGKNFWGFCQEKALWCFLKRLVVLNFWSMGGAVNFSKVVGWTPCPAPRLHANAYVQLNLTFYSFCLIPLPINNWVFF